MDVLATLADGTLTVRRARADDLPALVGLLAADPVSAGRGDAVDDLAPYAAAFAEIDADPAHLLVCLDEADGTTVGTLQLSVLPNLGRRGTRRAQLEAVHVSDARRGRGYGAALVEWAVAEAGRRGCGRSSSPATRHGPARTASTSASGSRRRTWGSSGT